MQAARHFLTNSAQVRRAFRTCAVFIAAHITRRNLLMRKAAVDMASCKGVAITGIVRAAALWLHGRIMGGSWKGLAMFTKQRIYGSSQLLVVERKLHGRKQSVVIWHGQVNFLTRAIQTHGARGRNGFTFKSQNYSNADILTRTSLHHSIPTGCIWG